MCLRCAGDSLTHLLLRCMGSVFVCLWLWHIVPLLANAGTQAPQQWTCLLASSVLPLSGCACGSRTDGFDMAFLAKGLRGLQLPLFLRESRKQRSSEVYWLFILFACMILCGYCDVCDVM